MSEILFSDWSDTAGVFLEQTPDGQRWVNLEFDDGNVKFDDPHQFAAFARIATECAEQWLAQDEAELQKMREAI